MKPEPLALGHESEGGGATWAPAKLQRLIAPKSIALVGASETSFFGRIVIENLQRFGYQGRIFPVNPKRPEILGLKAYPDLDALPVPPDHVLLAVAPDAVLENLQTCTRMGAGGAAIISSGFGETHSDHGVELERQIAAFAREEGFPVLGPNCLAIINAFESCYPFGSAMAGKLMAGNVGVTMQSGGMIGGLLRSSYERMGYGYCVSTGNEAALETSDWIGYMLEDERIHVICAYIEGFRTPAKFLEVAERALEKEKPLIVLKVGRTEAGREAALAHTGSLAGADQVIDGIFRRYGVTRVSDFDEMIETAMLFSKTRGKRPAGSGFAAITASGGTRSMIADLASVHGIELAKFSPATTLKLEQALPAYASVSNPLDATGQVLTDTAVYKRVIQALMDDPAVHLITVFQTLGLPGEDTPYHVRLLNLALEDIPAAPKPVTVAAVSAQSLTEWQKNFLRSNPDLAFTQGLAETLQGVRSLMDYQQALLRHQRTRARGQVQGEVRDLRLPSFSMPGQPLRVATEHASKQALSACGIGVTREALVQDGDEACAAASSIGYPVALKLISPDLLHKTEAGAVLLRLSNEAELRAGCEHLLAKCAGDTLRREGLLVQEMVSEGVEAILGVVNDRQFGPCVMVGMGGIFVELLKDVGFAPAPVAPEEALSLIRRLKGVTLLDGLRGKGPYDIDALADALVKLSLLAWEARDRIEQVDINPLMVLPRGRGVKAVDALIILKEPDEARAPKRDGVSPT